MFFKSFFDHSPGFVAVSNLKIRWNFIFVNFFDSKISENLNALVNFVVQIHRSNFITKTNPGNQTIRFVMNFFDGRSRNRFSSKTVRIRRRHWFHWFFWFQWFHRTCRICGVQLKIQWKYNIYTETNVYLYI